MRQIFWPGTAATRGGTLVAWDVACQPLTDGGLGIRHVQHINAALLGKWVSRVMKHADDIVSRLLHEMYGCSLD